MTEMSSQVRQLGEVAQFINGGAWGQGEYATCGIPVVQVSNIRGSQIDLTDCKYLPESSLEKYAKHLIRQDDLIIATVGSHPSQPNSVVGRPAIARSNAVNALLNQNAVIIRSTCDDVDQKWLGWLGRDQLFRDYIIGCARGSASQVRMAIGLLKQMPINIPPLRTQRRIAEILGAYDDLIQVNRRRIAVLEEMARSLFAEWFTRMRFPGHEGVTIEDTPDGSLPAGWHQATLGSLLEHTVGGLWGEASETNTEDQRVSVIRGTDFPKLLSGDYSSVPDRFVTSRELRSRAFLPGDLILEASGGSKDQPVGRIMYVTASLIEKLRAPVAPASFCRLLRPSDKFGGGAYLYCLLQAMYQDKRIEKFQKQSTGLRNLSMKQLAAETVIVPDAAILASFGKLTVPFLEAASLHRHECSTLGAARDLLLPRLMSGQLSVTQAERELEAVA